MTRLSRHASLAMATAAALFLPTQIVRAGTVYNFQTIDNAGDPAFNQLLGINNSGTIAGYFGDGTSLPNKGYTLSSPYLPGSYTNENFPASSQTQVVGINNGGSPTTVGFWVDPAGDNFGFVNQSGTFTSVVNPATPVGGTGINQLLGVNDGGLAAGFYVDGAGNANGYIYNITADSFTPITLPVSFNAVSVTATGINNAGLITGFYTDTAGATHGFIDNGGVFTSLDDPSGTGANTMFLGLNNHDQIVGSFLDGSSVTQGLLYDLGSNMWSVISDPSASTSSAFGVTGTTVNGINDKGDLVGFYSDGQNVNGFLANTAAAPEPGSMFLLGAGLAGLGAICRRRRRS